MRDFTYTFTMASDVPALSTGRDIPNILDYLMSGQDEKTGEMPEGGVPPRPPTPNCYDNGPFLAKAVASYEHEHRGRLPLFIVQIGSGWHRGIPPHPTHTSDDDAPHSACGGVHHRCCHGRPSRALRASHGLMWCGFRYSLLYDDLPFLCGTHRCRSDPFSNRPCANETRVSKLLRGLEFLLQPLEQGEPHLVRGDGSHGMYGFTDGEHKQGPLNVSVFGPRAVSAWMNKQALTSKPSALTVDFFLFRCHILRPERSSTRPTRT